MSICGVPMSWWWCVCGEGALVGGGGVCVSQDAFEPQ